MVTDRECPRCHRHAAYLIYPYWDSPYGLGGGLCTDCCAKATERFDEVGWPDIPADKDWSMMPYNCACEGRDEFCVDCSSSGIGWT